MKSEGQYICYTNHRSKEKSKTEGHPYHCHSLSPGGGCGHIRDYCCGQTDIALGDPAQYPGQHEDGEVAGHDPEEVGEGDAGAGEDHQRPATIPVTQTSNDGAGQELEEGEDGAQEASKENCVELHRGSNTAPKPVNLDKNTFQSVVAEHNLNLSLESSKQSTAVIFSVV